MAKFQATYKVINLCGLKRKEKVQYCLRAFQNHVYSTLINRRGRFICRRRNAVFNYSFTMYSRYVPTVFSLHCPTWKWTTSHSFHLFSHLGENSSIGLIRINPFPELLPDAVIYNYNPEPDELVSDDDNEVWEHQYYKSTFTSTWTKNNY